MLGQLRGTGSFAERVEREGEGEVEGKDNLWYDALFETFFLNPRQAFVWVDTRIRLPTIVYVDIQIPSGRTYPWSMI